MNNLKSAHIFLKIVAISAAISMVISSLSVYLFDLQTKSYASIVDLPISRVFTSNQINLSQKAYDLPLIRGIEVDSKNPDNIQFYFDTMNRKSVSSKEMNRMIKYFLGFLAIPEEKLWVNLSPYEKDRVLPDSLAKLDIGKDLLLEDYLLKQLTASLTNPKTKQGKKFWDAVYKKAYRIAGTTKVPIDTCYKVWIVPDVAEVYDYQNNSVGEGLVSSRNKTVAFVKDAKLKVMMETDYHNNVKQPGKGLISPVPNRHNLRIQKINAEAKEIFKKELLPIIQEQVNESVNFAPLRQMYYAWILATYLKGKIKSVGEGPCALSIQDYINNETAKPISLSNPDAIKEKIYQAYLERFKQGMYNTVKQEVRAGSKPALARQYFSGGVQLNQGEVFKFHSFRSIAEMYRNFSGAIGHVKVKINEQKENKNSAVKKAQFNSFSGAPWFKIGFVCFGFSIAHLSLGFGISLYLFAKLAEHFFSKQISHLANRVIDSVKKDKLVGKYFKGFKWKEGFLSKISFFIMCLLSFEWAFLVIHEFGHMVFHYLLWSQAKGSVYLMGMPKGEVGNAFYEPENFGQLSPIGKIIGEDFSKMFFGVGADLFAVLVVGIFLGVTLKMSASKFNKNIFKGLLVGSVFFPFYYIVFTWLGLPGGDYYYAWQAIKQYLSKPVFLSVVTGFYLFLAATLAKILWPGKMKLLPEVKGDQGREFHSLGKIFSPGVSQVNDKLASLFTPPGGIAFNSKFLNAAVKPARKIPKNYQGFSYEIINVQYLYKLR